MIKNLRELVDIQQFKKLNKKANKLWEEEKNLEVLPLLALSLAHLKEYKKTFEYIQKCEQSLEELSLDSKVDLAGVYALLHRVEDAISLLEPIIKKEPEHSLALARLAWCYFQMDKTDEAIKLYKKSSLINSNRIPVYSGLAKLYLEEKDISQAQESLDKGINHLSFIENKMPNDAVELFKNQFEELQLNIWVVQDNFISIENYLVEKNSLDEEQYSKKIIILSLCLAQHYKHDQAQNILREALKKYPKNQELILQLASLASIQGHTMQEINMIQKAIKIAKEQDKQITSLYVRLSNAYLHSDDKKALQVAIKAQELVEKMSPNDDISDDEIKQLNLQVKTTIAQAKSQLQEFDEAEILYNEVLEENPYLVNALQGLGSQLMQLGRIDEAVELYERVKQIDPLQGVSALINARKFPQDKETLLKMEKLANRPTLEGEVRSGILFQLASAWEKLKEYDKAFEVLDKANSSSKKLLSYSAKNHRQYCARIRYAFCKDLYKHRANYGLNSTMPVFVLGMPRSGTTLIEQILASHSQIFGAGELGIIPSRIQGLNRWERHTGSRRVYPDIMDDLDDLD